MPRNVRRVTPAVPPLMLLHADPQAPFYEKGIVIGDEIGVKGGLHDVNLSGELFDILWAHSDEFDGDPLAAAAIFAQFDDASAAFA
jgi:hypothetical protein